MAKAVIHMKYKIKHSVDKARPCTTRIVLFNKYEVNKEQCYPPNVAHIPGVLLVYY